MFRYRERRSVRMPGFIYLRTRSRYSCLSGDTRCDLRGMSGGFTVIEILIVVVIIAIAAMTVIPLMTSAASVQIRSAAHMIMADLEYAKSISISRGEQFSVEWCLIRQQRVTA
jgi:prepilin-type N-terminal cleavage/methylation domain-containing protein